MNTQDNKLIAEFMGLEEHNSCEYLVGNHIRNKNDLDYHKSWDWLIPVVKNIVPPKGWQLGGVKLQSIIMQKMQYANIEEVFEAVVNFIKWYNSSLNNLQETK